LSKGQRQYHGARLVCSTNGAGTNGQKCAKNETTQMLYLSQKLTQLNNKLKCKTMKLLDDKLQENLDNLDMVMSFGCNTKVMIHERNYW
jgi:2-succinyl-5-enolpyruvyl-6-hydroxy-3-cyclohexene-1-carboxylate synthase